MTRPTAAMRAAIANAEVGDEQYGEDPTVLELERRAADWLGHEAAVFVPTASMANQIALRILSQPGDELLAEENAHIMINEQGGPAVFSGLVMRGLPSRHGVFAPEQVSAAVRDWSSGHMPRTRVVSIENTHNSSGGRTWSLEQIDAIAATAREHDLRLHLDGARLVNAATALGVPAAEIGRRFDAVVLCLSKGLGCPLGALVAGSAELMVAGRRGKHLFGGAMRQAGIIAAAGLYALDHHVERIADDHARARRLAEGWAAAGLPVDPAATETNFVHIDLAPLGLTMPDAIARAEAAGVGISDTVNPTILRALTHLDISDDDIDRAIELVPQALGAGARVNA
ncbi:MAG: threonine aldolase [Gaiellaceae bacterium]|jgi:threonine aldolase|nr:threonine aldolase [Gaiellaceae bacterium]